ncbi:MAG TPA: hypothetical protein VLF20_01815 [Patescibacteria group bacterium]|nr:hypothetical protein [Patescibacteria group bacterium]
MSERVRGNGPFAKFRRMSAEHGMTAAAAELFQDANIAVSLRGRTASWGRTGIPVLFIGDHRKGLEPAVFAAAMGQVGRRDIHFLGLPFGITNKVAHALDERNVNFVLPVWPRYLAKDSPKRGREKKLKPKQRVMKLVFGRRLSRKEIDERNGRSLSQAADKLRQGECLYISPTGSSGKRMDAEWYSGVGTILAKLNPAEREKTLVVPFVCEGDYNPMRLARSMARRVLRIPSLPQQIVVSFGKEHQSVYQLVGNKTDPADITDILKRYYLRRMSGNL